LVFASAYGRLREEAYYAILHGRGLWYKCSVPPRGERSSAEGPD
jgi:hypothetical protein